jgi:serine/threonine protein kinase
MTVAVGADPAGEVAVRPGGPRPATRLGGRFRLDERIVATAPLALWKATDELLSRPVTIHLLPHGVPVPAHVVAVVQAAARVNDPRLATIYDTDYGSENPYLVSEWTRGTHLEDLVLSGLPRPALAAAMIADAADALAVAHQARLPHLCLSPRALRWDAGSGLKITGLGIDAALSGASAADPAAADTMALGQMLYALLTGYWPGDEPTALPAAPRHKGRVYTPRQVRAGVPGVLDGITCHALQLQPPGAARSELTPAGMAVALRSVLRPLYPSFRPAAPTGPRHTRTGPGRAGVRHRTTLLRPAA